MSVSAAQAEEANGPCDKKGSARKDFLFESVSLPSSKFIAAEPRELSERVSKLLEWKSREAALTTSDYFARIRKKRKAEELDAAFP